MDPIKVNSGESSKGKKKSYRESLNFLEYT